MIGAFDTDESYLSEISGKSHVAAHYYMIKQGQKEFNGEAIDALSVITKHVMSSESKAETGALNYGSKHATPYRVALEEMGHLQSKPTPVTNNNNVSPGITMGTMTSKASTPNNMRF